MKKTWKALGALLLAGLMLVSSVPAFASGESVQMQTWTAADGAPTSSYRAAAGTKLAFVSAASIANGAAAVDIWVDGVLYEDIAVENYGELVSLMEASGLNGSKKIVLTGVMEYAGFDAAAGTVALYNAVGPNDNILHIPDETTQEAVRAVFEGLFYYGTAAGVEAYYTFDNGYGLYVDGFYAPVAADCVYYAISEDGLAVLDGPANAIYEKSALAKAGFEAPYSLAVTERNEAGEISAIYYSNVVSSADTTTIRLGMDDNAAVDNELTREYGKYLDYDFNGFTAKADIAETAIYLYTGAAEGVAADGTAALAYADGAMNTYAPVEIESIVLEEDGLVGEEFANGKAVAYATNGGLLSVDYARIDNQYSVANCGILGALEAGSISWGLSQESGYNALIFATNGGTILFGDPEGERSYVRGYGQIGNAIFATGAGMYDIEGVAEDGVATTAGTAEAYVYNTDIWVDGWNGHITDATRGGFVYLEDVEGYSGYPGSAIGNGSGLTTDTGDGMVIAKDSHIEVFGLASGGIYVIGSNSTGVAINCDIRSWLDGGAVSASGGRIIAIDSTITGKAGFRNRGGATGNGYFEGTTIIADNAYSGTVTLFEGRDYEKTIDFTYNHDFNDTDRAQYVTNAVGEETLAVFELSLPGSIYRNTLTNTADTAKYDNLYLLAGANGYNGKWNYIDVFNAPYCWSNGESASYVTCFEFESSSMTLDIVNGYYDILNDTYDPNDDTLVKDYDFLIVSEFGSSPTLNFKDHEDAVTGIIYNEGYTTTHLNMGMPTTDESELEVNFENTDFIGVFADGDLGLWETDIAYENVNGELTSLNGNYFCATPNGKGEYSFDADSTWYVWSDSYAGTLTLADESCVESFDGEPKNVYVCNYLTIGDVTYTEGQSVTVGDITFTVDSSVFGQEPAPWTGEYTITASVVADDTAAAAAAKVTVPAMAAFEEQFDILVEVPEGYGVAYVTACGKILGAAEEVKCTASFSVELEGVLDIEVAIAPVEGAEVWQYADNGDGTVTITGSSKYTENHDYLYCIVPAEIDGKPVKNFGDGSDNILYRSGVYSITFREGIETFGYQALYDLNGCAIGVLPASATAIDEGFARSMPIAVWGIQAACDAAQDFVDASEYSYDYTNAWEEANIEAMQPAGSMEMMMGSGEPSMG